MKAQISLVPRLPRSVSVFHGSATSRADMS